MRKTTFILAAAISSCSSHAPAPKPPAGELRQLTPLPVEAPLPPGAQLEDLSGPGLPRRVNVTSLKPELIFDLEEVDARSPPHEDVLRLATSASVPGDHAELRKDEKDSDGTFTVLVEHNTPAGSERVDSFTVDTRVRAGTRAYDCTGTASGLAVAQRLEATCKSLREF